jgi:hypothetical protein
MSFKASDIKEIQKEKAISREARDYFIQRVNRWIFYYKLGNWQVITAGYALKNRNIDLAIHSYSFVERKVIVKFNYSYHEWLHPKSGKLNKKHINKLALFCASLLSMKKGQYDGLSQKDLLLLAEQKMHETIAEIGPNLLLS